MDADQGNGDGSELPLGGEGDLSGLPPEDPTKTPDEV